VREFPQYFSWLYEIKRVVPRAYIVTKYSVEKDSVRVLKRLSTNEFDPMKEVILDSEISVAPSGNVSARVDIQRYENNAVTIAAASNSESILILTDSFYPGWKAYVDGTETAIVRANHFYRAVRLPGGEHQVEFRYEPWSFKLGAVISLATLFIMVLISIVVYMKQRKRATVSISASVEMVS
jgi:uncharacterized membrane protein YfhO